MWAVRMSYNSHSSISIFRRQLSKIFSYDSAVFLQSFAAMLNSLSCSQSLSFITKGGRMDKARTVDNIHFHVTSPATQIYLRVYFRQPWAVFNCYLKRCDKVGLSTQIFSNLENRVPSWFDLSPGALHFLLYLLEPITWAPGTSRRMLIRNRALIRDRALIFEKQQNVQKKSSDVYLKRNNNKCTVYIQISMIGLYSFVAITKTE